MKLWPSDSPISRTLRAFVGLFGPSFEHLPTLQAHSSRRPLNNSFSHHPQVAQRKQCCQLRRIFDQSPIPSLAIAKMAFDRPEGVSHFGPNAGHGRITQGKSLLHKLDAMHCGNTQRRSDHFACGRKGLDQLSQLQPRHNKFHLVEKLTLAYSLGFQFKSGRGEGGFFMMI